MGRSTLQCTRDDEKFHLKKVDFAYKDEYEHPKVLVKLPNLKDDFQAPKVSVRFPRVLVEVPNLKDDFERPKVLVEVPNLKDDFERPKVLVEVPNLKDDFERPKVDFKLRNLKYGFPKPNKAATNLPKLNKDSATPHSNQKGILTWADHVNQLVAVKWLDVSGFQGSKEFRTEVTMLSEYKHKNIITLIGFCDDNEEMILVYEYASHGSLDTYLCGNTVWGGLSWPQLLKICIGVASALDYLHNHVAEKHRIIHRDVKSVNVLLDENWNAKLSDFGLARIGLANQHNTFVITNIAGTYGYCDPQYEKTGFLTKESDVYSFGVVLFEVLCGRLACTFSYHDERRFLHHWARMRYKNGDLDKIIDHRIKTEINPRTLSKFSAIAYQCLHKNREERPKIAEIAFQLGEAWKIQSSYKMKEMRLLSHDAQEIIGESLLKKGYMGE
ncbi:unnamed protein product [Lactuca saligna]|uniref:Protein kinase domain-containing protein n=1 Tax=Lactuca saligna TaxID=75948 RepID=A0AA35YP12_LACSI|nr:unnamed protein product [Lactuca saligna]